MSLTSQSPTVALLEPDPDYVKMWKHFLKDIYPDVVIKELQTATELHDLLVIEKPDLIIFEYELPDTKGTYLLSELSDDLDLICIPTIMSSGSCPDSVIIDAYKQGLHSFVNKNGLVGDILKESITIATNKVARMIKSGKSDDMLPSQSILPVDSTDSGYATHK